MVDSRFRVLLNPTQQDSARLELLHYLKDQSGSESSGTSTPRSPATTSRGVEEPPPKRLCHLAKLLKQRNPEEHELEQYLTSIPSLEDGVDPVMHWVEQENMYPLLAPLSIDLLTIPGSSAPIERTFSTAGESSGGKRNRLSDVNLEREVLLRKNRAYIQL